jgi:hypothetical protein
MVRFDQIFVVFTLYERKNDKRENKNRSAEGSEHQLRKP